MALLNRNSSDAKSAPVCFSFGSLERSSADKACRAASSGVTRAEAAATLPFDEAAAEGADAATFSEDATICFCNCFS